MKNEVLKYLKVYIITFLILITLLLLTALIPRKNIYNNIINSFKYYYNNHKVGYLNNTNLEDSAYRIYYSADMKSLCMSSLIDENKPLSSIIKMNYYIEFEYGFKDFSDLIKNSSGTIKNYSRYWQGQIIYIKLLLTVTDIRNIYILNTVIFIILFLILLIKLFEKDLKLAISFLIGAIVTNLFIVPFCLTYFFAFIISFIGSILIIKINDNNIGILFMVLGMLTCFFDFLTCETLTLTLPLFIYTYLKIKNKQKITIKIILKYILLWFIGYASLFMIKWLIDCIYYGPYFIKNILSNISFRIYNKNKNVFGVLTAGIIKVVDCLFPLNKINYSITIFTTIILFISYYYIFYFKNKMDYNKLLLLIAVIPILRLIILSAHTDVHYFFVYRALLPLIMLISLICVNKLSIENRKAKKISN